MIKTIDECDQELLRLDAEFKRLEMERNHILSVREFLKHQSTVTLRKTLTQRILEVLTANPGLNTLSVRDALNDETLTSRKVSFTLANLRKAGRVENRGGGKGHTAVWYIKENP